jgi:hypothetical protein
MFLHQPKDLINLINLIKLSRFSMDNLATAKSGIALGFLVAFLATFIYYIYTTKLSRGWAKIFLAHGKTSHKPLVYGHYGYLCQPRFSPGVRVLQRRSVFISTLAGSITPGENSNVFCP